MTVNPADSTIRRSAGADELRVAADRLIGPVSRWSASRWLSRARPVESGRTDGVGTDVVLPDGAGALPDGTCAEVAYAAAVQLAALGAEAEGRPGHRLPRPEYDVGIPDQLTVLVNDLIEFATEPVLDRATDVVRSTSRRLLN